MRIYSVSVCVDWNAREKCLRETWQVCVCVYVCCVCVLCVCVYCVSVCVYMYIYTRIHGVSVCIDCNANGECLRETS